MVSSVLLGDASTQLVQGLSVEDCARVQTALDYASDMYGERRAATGQDAFEFSLGVAGTLAVLRTDAETRIAGLLFELAMMDPAVAGSLEERFGKEVSDLVQGVYQLVKLRDLTAGKDQVAEAKNAGKNAAQQAAAQVETLRKMLLAMASDMRVVLPC